MIKRPQIEIWLEAPKIIGSALPFLCGEVFPVGWPPGPQPLVLRMESHGGLARQESALRLNVGCCSVHEEGMHALHPYIRLHFRELL